MGVPEGNEAWPGDEGDDPAEVAEVAEDTAEITQPDVDQPDTAGGPNAPDIRDIDAPTAEPGCAPCHTDDDCQAKHLRRTVPGTTRHACVLTCDEGGCGLRRRDSLWRSRWRSGVSARQPGLRVSPRYHDHGSLRLRRWL
jgi:hypothetical protein